jgi:hypothetical protein
LAGVTDDAEEGVVGLVNAALLASHRDGKDVRLKQPP